MGSRTREGMSKSRVAAGSAGRGRGECRAHGKTWKSLGIVQQNHLVLLPANDGEVDDKEGNGESKATWLICRAVFDDAVPVGLILPSDTVQIKQQGAKSDTNDVAVRTPSPDITAEVKLDASPSTPCPDSSKKATTPFSFKDFSISLSASKEQNLDTSLTAQSTISTPIRVPLRHPFKIFELENIEVSGISSTRIKISETPRPVIASSVSIELNLPAVDITNVTRKRIQSWFHRLYLCEGSIIDSIGDTNLRGRVRRTVPAGSYVICGRDTRIILEDPTEIQTAQLEFDLVEESNEVHEKLRHIISRFEYPERYKGFDNLALPKGYLLYGPPGTGKSHTVKSLVEHLKKMKVPVSFQAPQPGDFKTSKGGDYALNLTFQTAQKFIEAHPDGISIIFLDELDSYTASRSSAVQDSNNHIGRILTLMDGVDSKMTSNRIIVFGATNHVDTIDPALRRPGRFDKEIIFRLPTDEERYRSVIQLLRKEGVEIATREKIAEFFRDKCVGFSFADIIAQLRNATRCWDFTDSSTWKPRIASSLRGAIDLSSNEDPRSLEIGGQDDAKRALRMAIEWPITRREELERFGMNSLFRGVLLYGPPGCAKTSLVRSIATFVKGKASFYSLSGADIYSSGFGEAEQAIRRVFTQARATAPSILFFDEVDSLVGTRDGKSASQGSDSVQSRVLSTFLNEMDGVDTLTSDAVVVVGATNSPENIDKALLRPGRFDRLVFVGPPDPVSVLEIEVRAMNLEGSIDCEALRKDAIYMSGADIAGACRLAALAALSRNPNESPTQEDFAINLKQGMRSCTPDVIERYRKFQPT